MCVPRRVNARLTHRLQHMTEGTAPGEEPRIARIRVEYVDGSVDELELFDRPVYFLTRTDRAGAELAVNAYTAQPVAAFLGETARQGRRVEMSDDAQSAEPRPGWFDRGQPPPNPPS